ncbi:MAG TPA: hypothetical protein VN026_18570 [Bacteroidia bacterium]|jgi:hypothetical protein|nr:hypothetical protein [Bacteroidia bacterium]
MENEKSAIESLVEKVETYGKTSFDLLKLKAIDKTADAVSTTVSYVFIALFIFMFILVASIGAALWLGEILGKTYYGLFCVAGFYGILGVVLYLLRDSIKKPVTNSIITHALN